MTFSQRRRLFNFLWFLASNSALPFILGFVVALISTTHIISESFNAVDKAGFGYCVQSKDGRQ